VAAREIRERSTLALAPVLGSMERVEQVLVDVVVGRPVVMGERLNGFAGVQGLPTSGPFMMR
jgi:hypothetical protein